MLAAAQIKRSPLETFEVSLNLMASNTAELPTSLQRYVMDVITQAKSLSQDPNMSLRATDILPEAIILALEMKVRNILAIEINKITNFESINSELAFKLLSQLESNVAFQN